MSNKQSISDSNRPTHYLPTNLQVDLESRTESKRNLWLASGMKPKHGEVKVRGRPGGKADQFPVDLDEVENEALRDALRRMRDGVYPVRRI